MKRTIIYTLCLMAMGFTACEKEPVNQDQGLSAALSWADETDKGRDIKDACIWIFNADGKQVVKQHYNSKQEVALDIHPLDAGEYKVVTAINLSSPFFSDDEDTFDGFTIKTNDAKANPEHAHYSVATIRAEHGKNIRTPLTLRRILSEITVEVEGVPKGSTLEAAVSNAADGVMPATKDADNSWGKATNRKLSVTLPGANEQSNKLITQTIRLMPTVRDMSYSYLSLAIHLTDGTLHQCEVEAPVMKSGGKYHLKLNYSELKPFMHVEPIQITDWVENWTVNGEISDPIPVRVELDLDGFTTTTRANTDGIAIDDIRNFFLLIENPTDPAYTYMVQMDHSYSDWRAYDLGTSNQRKLFFKNGTDPVHIKAVYWGNGSFTNFFLNKSDRWTRPYNILLDKDISFSSSYITANDPVYANTTIIPKESCPNGKLRLAFRHLFAKVKFTVQIPFTSATRKYMIAESSPISDLKVEGLCGAGYNGKYLNWVAASSEINKPEGIVAEPFTLTRYKWTPYYDLTTNYMLMVIPQAVTDGTFKVSFQFEGETYNWICSEKDFRFETNKEYEITLKITTTRSAAGTLSGTIKEGGRL